MKTKDWILCIIVLMIWSSSSSLVAVFAKGSNELLLAGSVLFVSALVLSIQMINKEQRSLLKLVKISEMCKLFVPALLGVFFYPIAYFIGINGASPIRANVLNYLWPLIAFITSALLKRHRVKKIGIVSMVFASLGGYVVLCFNKSVDLYFNSEDYIYALIALLGAFFYGVYTATIDLFIPKTQKQDKEVGGHRGNNLPANLRVYVMIMIAAILHIIILSLYLIFNPIVVKETYTIIFSGGKTTICFIVYSIVNFSVAHYLWNKLNIDVNVSLTSSMAFLIPLVSTIVLSVTSKETMDFVPAIGLTLIVVSIILNNYKDINSINSTFVGIVVILMFVGIVPLIDDEKIVENAKFFLEIIIALYSIYYGFVMSRVINDYKEFVALVDSIVIYKRNKAIETEEISKGLEERFRLLEKWSKGNKHGKYVGQNILLSSDGVSGESNLFLEEKYHLLFRYSKNALSISEWLVIIILSILIIVLCFIVREDNVMSNLIVISIGATICLCVSSLYEYEIKKSTLLRLIITN